MKRIEVTQAIEDALELVARAERAYVPGLDSGAVLELPKLALADAVLEAVAAQQGDRVRRLPARAVPMIIEIEMRPKRKRRA